MHVLKIQDLNTIYVFLLLSNYARSLTQPLEKFLSTKSPLKEEFSTLMQNSFNWGQISIRQKALWTNDAVFPWKSRPELTSCQVFIIFFPCRILFIFTRTYGQPHPQRVLNQGLHITTSPIISLLAIRHAFVGNVFNIYQWSSSINVCQHFMYTLHHVNWALIKDIRQST